MCGIIGYIGAKPVVPVLLDGLRRMEYRGYDSAGVALVSPEGINLRRSAGKLVNLENAIRNEPVDGLYGVGHTRWATHGRPKRTRTRTVTAPARSSSSTMASSRTTSS